MASLTKIDKLLKDYKLWTIRLNSNVKNIKNTILQNDKSDALEEKILSIGISSIFMWIVGGIIGLFIVVNIVASIVLFGIGLLLSKFVNKKVFGTPRKIEDISDAEKEMLKILDKITSIHKSIRDEINKGNRIVYFQDYPSLKKKFSDIVDSLTFYDRSHLAIKYRTKYLLVVKDYKDEIKKFDAIFAHKY